MFRCLTDVIAVCKRALEKSYKISDEVLRRGPLLAHLEVYNRLIKHEYFPNNELQMTFLLGYFLKML